MKTHKIFQTLQEAMWLTVYVSRALSGIDLLWPNLLPTSALTDRGVESVRQMKGVEEIHKITMASFV